MFVMWQGWCLGVCFLHGNTNSFCPPGQASVYRCDMGTIRFKSLNLWPLASNQDVNEKHLPPVHFSLYFSSFYTHLRADLWTNNLKGSDKTDRWVNEIIYTASALCTIQACDRFLRWTAVKFSVNLLNLFLWWASNSRIGTFKSELKFHRLHYFIWLNEYISHG